MRIRFLQPARDELREAFSYYEGQRAELGREFLAEARDTVQRIQQHPGAWHPLGRGFRRCMTRRFPYGVIYQVRDDEVLIVAVAHLRREPSYWFSRLDENE